MKLKCTKEECEYEWNYTGKKHYPGWVTCPYCLNKVKLPKEEDAENDGDE